LQSNKIKKTFDNIFAHLLLGTAIVTNHTADVLNNSHTQNGLCFRLISTNKVKRRHEMSRGIFDNNKDIDDEALTARCESFIERMERKLAYKESLQLDSDGLGSGRY
jgi:hypothetical protein